MKKMFLLAAMAAATMVASAQVWIGGEVGYNFNKDKDADNGQHTLVIAPEVGVDLNETWSVAAALGYKHGSFADSRLNGFSVSPYVRYKFAKSGNVTFFVDGALSYSYEDDHTAPVKVETNTFGVAFKPGLAYGFCEKAGLVAHFGALGYDLTKEGDAKNNNFGFDFANNLTFGIYFNL